MQYNKIQFNTIQYNSIQYYIIYITILYNFFRQLYVHGHLFLLFLIPEFRCLLMKLIINTKVPQSVRVVIYVTTYLIYFVI